LLEEFKRDKPGSRETLLVRNVSPVDRNEPVERNILEEMCMLDARNDLKIGDLESLEELEELEQL